MKLHHFETNGKESFLKKNLLRLIPQINSFNVNPALEKQKQIFNTNSVSSNGKSDVQLQESIKITSLEAKLTKLYDRVGRAHNYDFMQGNICIFGDDLKAARKFSNTLQIMFAGIQHEVKIIKAEQLSLKKLNNSKKPLLILVSKQIPQQLLSLIILSCPTICILRSKESKIVCSLNGKVKSNSHIKEVINTLRGNLILRELMIASLTENEFLLIENTYIDKVGKEAVRSFQTVIKQPFKLLNPIEL